MLSHGCFSSSCFRLFPNLLWGLLTDRIESTMNYIPQGMTLTSLLQKHFVSFLWLNSGGRAATSARIRFLLRENISKRISLPGIKGQREREERLPWQSVNIRGQITWAFCQSCGSGDHLIRFQDLRSEICTSHHQLLLFLLRLLSVLSSREKCRMKSKMLWFYTFS